MKVRITHERRDTIDGFALERLKLDQIYDLPASVAAYLVVTKSAELPDVLQGTAAEPGFEMPMIERPDIAFDDE
jgi:hypothetical protein